MKSNQSIHQDQYMITIDSIYCLHRAGDHQTARTLSMDGSKEFSNSSLYLNILKMIELIGNYEENKLNLAHFDELESQLIKPLEAPGYELYLGWLYFLKGYGRKNHSDLNSAAIYFKKNNYYIELYEVIYWINAFKFLELDEDINCFLRLHPVKSIYSKIMGNNFYKDELLPRTQLQKNQARSWMPDEDTLDGGSDTAESEDSFDSWVIEKNSISPTQYRNLKIKDENYLDIYSGLINDRGEFIFLLLSELNCLSLLIATQYTGVSSCDIGEFLGKSPKESEIIIETIKQLGIPIKKLQNLYFLNWENKPKIIIPRTLKVLGLYEFVRKQKTIFSKNELIDILQLTQFGAESLMKKWALAGHIRPVENTSNWKFQKI